MKCNYILIIKFFLFLKSKEAKKYYIEVRDFYTKNSNSLQRLTNTITNNNINNNDNETEEVRNR